MNLFGRYFKPNWQWLYWSSCSSNKCTLLQFQLHYIYICPPVLGLKFFSLTRFYFHLVFYLKTRVRFRSFFHRFSKFKVALSANFSNLAIKWFQYLDMINTSVCTCCIYYFTITFFLCYTLFYWYDFFLYWSFMKRTSDKKGLIFLVNNNTLRINISFPIKPPSMIQKFCNLIVLQCSFC